MRRPARQRPRSRRRLQRKGTAPRFSATTTTGEKFTNRTIQGKVALFEFWTTWCGYCADEAAFVDKIGKELAAKGLILLAFDVGESKKTVKKYLEQHPRDCKIVLMEDTNLAAMYQATVYPIYVVINRDGFIAGTQRGAGGEEALGSLPAPASSLPRIQTRTPLPGRPAFSTKTGNQKTKKLNPKAEN